MPLIDKPTYCAPVMLRNGHLLTVYPTLFRKVENPDFKRTRLETKDGDFIDLDFLRADKNKHFVILMHGLEGSSDSVYIRAMSKALVGEGCSVCVQNFRGCSGEVNRHLRAYHAGFTDDLKACISFIEDSYQAKSISLVGFSLGANIALNYLGRESVEARKKISKAVMFSAPCDLSESGNLLSRLENRIYEKRFLADMISKTSQKAKRNPEEVDLDLLAGISSVREFDDKFTAPLNGFEGVEDYWEKNSSKHHLHDIQVPTLLVNALDDPLLGPKCSPIEVARQSEYLHLELPRRGGHNGFVSFFKEYYWSEIRAIDFLSPSFC